ncbi:hypothetical protein NHH03_04910 [Stieleria sp. TO1_6]|nr:hypothetical protein [Stieleria tagensis]
MNFFHPHACFALLLIFACAGSVDGGVIGMQDLAIESSAASCSPSNAQSPADQQSPMLIPESGNTAGGFGQISVGQDRVDFAIEGICSIELPLAVRYRMQFERRRVAEVVPRRLLKVPISARVVVLTRERNNLRNYD